MRRIVTAVTAAALALSLVVQTTPAAAVTGYDSAYAGESAFLTLDQGDTGTFTVFFANTGTTTWTTGTGSQVDLAACLEDKTTCNSQDADEAEFNPGTWRSATRYATHTQTSVAPGQIGTFTYNVEVPSDAAADTYRFNGALVLSATGADIRNEGYYQDVTVLEGGTGDAATIDELDPAEGSIEGGDTVVITGEGIACDGVMVSFGDEEADVVSCGETSITVETPAADAADTVEVTVTNEGADASNPLDFVYVDDVAPTFDSVEAVGQAVTLTFSEGVCVAGGALDDSVEFLISVNGDSVDADSVEFADCDDDETSTTATSTITGVDVVEGDTVTVTITSDGADAVEDAGGNTMERAQTRTDEAEADLADPTATGAEALDDEWLELTLSEPVTCDSVDTGDFTYTTTDDSVETADSVDCDGTTDTISLFFGDGAFNGTEGTLAYANSGDSIEDLQGNPLGEFENLDVTPLEGTGDPIITGAAVTRAGFVNAADTDDSIELTFDQTMDEDTDDVVIRIEDADGTIYDLECGADDTVECDWADSDELIIEFQQNPLCGSSTDTDDEQCLATGDVAGIQWPATIIDVNGLTDSDEGEQDQLDLENSEDVTIEASN